MCIRTVQSSHQPNSSILLLVSSDCARSQSLVAIWIERRQLVRVQQGLDYADVNRDAGVGQIRVIPVVRYKVSELKRISATELPDSPKLHSKAFIGQHEFISPGMSEDLVV